MDKAEVKLNFTADAAKCLRCGLCVKICPSRIVRAGSSGIPSVPEKLERFCLGCQQCMAVCPAGAISVFGRNPQELPKTLPAGERAPEKLLNIIQTRRSCRFYKHENISAEKMKKLKEMLAYVPTGCNSRGLHFCFADDVAAMDKIREKVSENLKKLVKFVPPFNSFVAGYKKEILSGSDIVFWNAPHMAVACVSKNAPCRKQDPFIALSYFELYANALGLGTLWCGIADGALRLMPSVRKMLKIPAGHKIGYVMLFGEPAVKFPRAAQQEPYGISSAEIQK